MFGEGGYTPPGDEQEETEGRDNIIKGSDHLPQTKEEWDKAMGIMSGEEQRRRVDEILNPPTG